MLKRNFFYLFSVTIFAIASLVLCLYNYNPFVATSAIFVNFYVSLFASLAGVITLILYYIKYFRSKDKLVYATFFPSLRQAVFLSLALTMMLLLKGLDLLDWWIGTSIVMVAILSELFFQTKKQAK
ncbi:MAG: hypothetical protein BWY68_00226 [bacterium ADurb.Bin400]|nr:MAG: hypothetical protein BWY68_00226 [bacterium ADurb.Bin400]